MRDTPRPGELFEGHLIEGELGRGGMGMVLRARSVALDRPRAIKVIAPELSTDPAYAARFRRESRLAASVEHPNVVTVHAAGEDDGMLFIVMRLVEGFDLHRLLADGPLAPERALRILDGVAAGLDAAHRAGLVHRDVKPANVLIEPRGDSEHAYLTDFGISKPVATRTAGGSERTSATALTAEGQVLGTADYVAPEQVEHGRSDARSDVYSLACVAYHLLVGEPPFRRETQVATLIAQTKAERPSASAANPTLRRDVDDVLRRGMAIDPAERPASAGAFADALAEAVAGPVGRDPSNPVAPVDPAAAPTVGLPQSSRGRPRNGIPRRRRIVIGLLAAAALAGGAAVAAILLPGGDDGDAGPSVVTEPVGAGPVGIASGDRRVWVTNRDAEVFGAPPGEVTRLRRDRPVMPRGKPPIPLPRPRAVAIGLGSVWVVNDRALYELGGGAKPEPIAVGSRPDDVAVDNSYVWVTDESGDAVYRVDPNDVNAGGDPQVRKIAVGDEPRSIAADRGLAWVANAGDGTVSKIDAASLRVLQTIPVGPRPTSIAVGPSSAWVTDAEDGLLRQIAVRDSAVVGEPIAVAGAPRGVAVGLGSVWVASGGANVVERFDASSHERTGEPIGVGAEPADVAVGETAVYTANQAGNSVSRILP